MHAMLLAGLLLLLGVRGTAGYRASGDDFMISEDLARRRQLLKRLGVVGKARLEGAKCETEVQGDVPTVILLSGTGEGKSTTTCVLAGDPALAHVAVEGKAHSETSESCIHRASWYFPYDHSEPLYLIDTPGFGDTRGADTIKFNNEDIVKTLKRGGRAHAVLWVLNSQDAKMNKGRQDAFRFVRSYFGKAIYKHIVFVYTKFSWNKKKGPRKGRVFGPARQEALDLQHNNTMKALLDVVEIEFWPDGKVDQGVNETIMRLPKFGLNTFAVNLTESDPDEHGMTLMDNDIPDDDYNENDPDGFYGVLNPNTFKTAIPNSATQLQGLKKKILEISKAPPVDLTNLRPFQDGCKAALKDTVMMTEPVVFGQHVTDCVEGQQYKLLKEEVAPHVNNLQDGPQFAAFSIKAYTGGRGPTASELKDEAMKELGIPESARENAEAFTSYDACLSCRNAQRGQDEAELVKRLSTCLGGIARADDTPALVEAMKLRFFSKEAKAAMTPASITKVVAEIEKLPEQERATVYKHMDFKSLLSRKVKLAITSINNVDLGTTNVVLTPSTTLASIIDGKVNMQPAVKLLKEQEWVDYVSLYDSDKNVLATDEDLQQEITGILAKDASENVTVEAQVVWVQQSPPQRLDPKLLQVCLDNHDALAAVALIKDHVTNPNVLVFTDPAEVMQNTADHGAVFQGVAALRDAEVLAFRADTEAATTSLTKDRDRRLEEVGRARQKLQPFLDEIKGDEQDMAGKVSRLLSALQGSSVMRLPKAVPSQATPAGLLAFAARLDEDLRTMEEFIKDKRTLGVEELIWQSQVLKGVYVGQVAEPRAPDLIQITKMPAPSSLLTPPESMREQNEMSSRSAGTISAAKQTLSKGGKSFAGSLSVSGAGMGNWGVGAVHLAQKVRSTMDETEQIAGSMGTEARAFHSLFTSTRPMRLLGVAGKSIRLTAKFLAETARILYKDEARWPGEIESLFSIFGTHYCPEVELGGIVVAEARLDSSKSSDNSDAEIAMANCTRAEFEAVGSGAFFGAGFVKGESCKADSSGEAPRTRDMMKSVRVTRSCISGGMGKCPASEDVFTSGLAANSNWGVIDRKMSKCVAVWDELKSEVYLDDLLQAGAARNQTSVDTLRELMAKVWHLKALDLPGLCKRVMGDSGCKEIADVASGPASELIAMPPTKIRNLWDKLSEKATARLEFDTECSKKDWCSSHRNQGECKMLERTGTTTRVMTCACKPTFGGDFCGEKIPKKACTKYKYTACAAHWTQQACGDLGGGWKYDTYYNCHAQRIEDLAHMALNPLGGATAAILGKQNQCKKTYECQPDAFGHDCCGSLGHGELWRP